jgi:uncharacterized lipoprotein YmbA
VEWLGVQWGLLAVVAVVEVAEYLAAVEVVFRQQVTLGPTQEWEWE